MPDDIEVLWTGTVAIVYPVTGEAHQWLHYHMPGLRTKTLPIESVGPLVAAAMRAGLTVGGVDVK